MNRNGDSEDEENEADKVNIRGSENGVVEKLKVAQCLTFE